jgi:hypothetical protein
MALHLTQDLTSLAGSAAKYIEKKLEKIGLQIIRPRSSAIVTATKGKWKATKADTTLREGAGEAIEAVRSEIGAVLLSREYP